MAALCRQVFGAKGQPRNDFDIEGPAADKWLCEKRADARRHSKQLGPALRVVQRQPESEGRHRREDAAAIVTTDSTTNGSAQQSNPRAEACHELWTNLQRVDEAPNLGQGSREVRIPVADVTPLVFERPQDAYSNGFGLPALSARRTYSQRCVDSGTNVCSIRDVPVRAPIVNEQTRTVSLRST